MRRKKSQDPRNRPREKIQPGWFRGKSRQDIFQGFKRAGWQQRNTSHIVFSKRGFGTISFPTPGRPLNPAIAALKFSQAGITEKEAMRILGISHKGNTQAAPYK